MTYPFGVDLSKWQGTNDFAKIKTTTAFVFVKATESWGYVDPYFVRNWQGLAGHNRGAYCYVYPESDPLRQANHLIDTVTKAGVDWKYDRLVLDLERSGHGLSRAGVKNMVLVMMERIKEVTGRYPILYSRASWVNYNMLLTDPRLINADWWLAYYRTALPYPFYTPEMPPPPLLPTGVSKWLIHQTCEKGKGREVGVGSYYVDQNRFNGTREELDAFFGRAGEIPEPEPEPEPIFQARVYSWATPYVNIRAQPTVNSAKRGVKYPLAVTDVMSTVPDWYEVPEGWMMSRFLERLDYQPPATMLAIKPLSQRDTRWASHKLGYSYYTIGGYGCLITAISMILNWYGKQTDPAQLNDALVRVGGFTGANLYWNAIAQVQPDVYLAKAIDCYYIPAPLHEIDALLADDVPVLVHVDFTPGGAVDQHWVLIVGKSGSDYIMNDPWFGDQTSFRDRYGDPARYIFRIRAYRRKA